MRASLKKLRIIHLLSAATAALVILCSAAILFARAGGGGGFSGGGGGGGGFGGGGGGFGGGGGGGDIGWIIYFWVRFCIEYPYIGLPVTVVVIVVIYKGHQTGMSAYRGSVIRRAGDVSEYNRTSEAAQVAAAVDPSFDADQMAQRVRTAFTKIQAAWCAQDPSGIRPFISDGVHERFSLQIEEQKAFGYQDRMENVAVNSVILIEFSEGHVFDVATMRIEAQASDYRVSLKDNRRLTGSTAVQPFVEMWSWLRRHGVTRDPSKPGLIEGHCPNCGAVVAMNQSAKCDHCGALLRSGEFDWVLTEITQQSEWRRGRHFPAPGTAELQKIDPAFNRADVEDRTSVMFWRKAMADRIGKIDPLRKIGADAFCSDYSKSLAPQPDGSREFFTDCAVGGTNLAGVFLDAEQHSAVVEVAWEGERTIAAPNHPLRPTGQRVQVHTLYLLTRKSGVTSDPGDSVSSAHCPKCGAPITSDISSACSYCGAVLNDGTHGWVLTEIASASSSDGQRWISRFHASSPVDPVAQAIPLTISPLGLLAWCVKITAADGQVDPDERQLLTSLADKCNIDRSRVDQMIEMALSNRLDIPDPPDHRTAHIWLSAMAAAAMADGAVNPPEAQLLGAAAKRFGFCDEDVNVMLRQQYAQRFAAAKSELRFARQRGNGSQ
jgi:DnaJ-domain-containing protein 1